LFQSVKKFCHDPKKFFTENPPKKLLKSLNLSNPSTTLTNPSPRCNGTLTKVETPRQNNIKSFDDINLSAIKEEIPAVLRKISNESASKEVVGMFELSNSKYRKPHVHNVNNLNQKVKK